MRAVVQRVKKGSVTVDGTVVSAIEHGFVILLGAGQQDSVETTAALAKKIAMLRVFEDDTGKMNLSILDVGGQALVISQFTLYADTRRGNRPSFIHAAPPETASPLVDAFCAQLASHGVPVQKGVFGAHMQVEILNDGPVTIWFDY